MDHYWIEIIIIDLCWLRCNNFNRVNHRPIVWQFFIVTEKFFSAGRHACHLVSNIEKLRSLDCEHDQLQQPDWPYVKINMWFHKCNCNQQLIISGSCSRSIGVVLDRTKTIAAYWVQWLARWKTYLSEVRLHHSVSQLSSIIMNCHTNFGQLVALKRPVKS